MVANHSAPVCVETVTFRDIVRALESSDLDWHRVTPTSVQILGGNWQATIRATEDGPHYRMCIDNCDPESGTVRDQFGIDALMELMGSDSE